MKPMTPTHKTYVKLNLRQDQVDMLMDLIVDGEQSAEKFVVESADKTVDKADLKAHLEYLHDLTVLYKYVETQYVKAKAADNIYTAQEPTLLDTMMSKMVAAKEDKKQ